MNKILGIRVLAVRSVALDRNGDKTFEGFGGFNKLMYVKIFRTIFIYIYTINFHDYKSLGIQK